MMTRGNNQLEEDDENEEVDEPTEVGNDEQEPVAQPSDCTMVKKKKAPIWG